MYNLKNSEIPKIRKQILEKQNFTCPLCGKHIEETDRITLDRQHKNKKSDPNGDYKCIQEIICIIQNFNIISFI